MYDLAKFTEADVTECGNALRTLGSGAGSMEETARKIVRHLYDNMVDPPNRQERLRSDTLL